MCIMNRNRPATTPSAITLPNQMEISQSTCRNQGVASFCAADTSVFSLSMVAIAYPHFSTEHVIAPAGVHQDDRQDEQRADQDEQLACRGRSRLPQADGRWNDVR